LLEYHDHEWGAPAHSDGKHFEVLVLSGAQAGLNWSLVLKKREGYRRAFDKFDPEKVARYSETAKCHQTPIARTAVQARYVSPVLPSRWSPPGIPRRWGERFGSRSRLHRENHPKARPRRRGAGEPAEDHAGAQKMSTETDWTASRTSVQFSRMTSKQGHFRIAVLDDYQNVALSMANWSVLDARATVTVFSDYLGEPDAVVARLQPFDIVCVMRERTPMTRAIIERLPKLRLIASTGTQNASIDLKAAEEHGARVVYTGYSSTPTIELTWALILASARNLVAENASLRGGGWQCLVGDDLAGRTLGVLGLGNIGSAVARIGGAFGMRVVAWSENLTAERAAEGGATLVTKDELLRQADIVTIHLVLSSRTRGLVGASEIALMKPTARLINTSRGPIVVETDLLAALEEGKIAGAAIDVFDQEPLPPDHPFRSLPNLLATPHIGYVSRGLYERFYQDTVKNILQWLDSQVLR
jgi:phosphoglycerate dehydrogenase-like enzyme